MPPPIGGWNARDALASMHPADAINLENWMPQTSYLELRGGITEFATGMTGTGKTLMVYNGLDGSDELFCMTGSGTYDVSVAGAVGASVLARTAGKHQWTMFGDGTDNWLIAVNGTDDPAYYNGTTWTAVDEATSPALTGYTGNAVDQFISVNVFKGRLFFIPKDSLSYWYLAAGVAGGALTEVNIAAECKRGGFLMAMATWTKDSGDGIDDYAVFITSEGEAIVYQGTDPSNASTWAKVGSFAIGKPIGRRCVRQYGPDVVLILENGVFPLSDALQTSNETNKLALSYKIERAFTDAARNYRNTFGWEVINYPAQNALIVNIPIAEDGIHEQYVMNTITKAWTKFCGWNAENFVEFNEELYLVNGTKTYKAWDGQDDDGSDIEAYGKQAFNYFQAPNQIKQIKAVRPVLSSNGSLTLLVGVDVDFDDVPLTGVGTSTQISGAQWDVDKWDEGTWEQDQEISKVWFSPSVWPGYCFALKMQVATSTLDIRWMSSDMVYESGDLIA